ncbi:hypothetical protein VPH35_004532 [Triticum aestivum]
MELRRRELRLYANTSALAPRWHRPPSPTRPRLTRSPWTRSSRPADLESFLKGRSYYHRLGRSTFVAAMARFLGYDVYDINLSHTGTDDLRALLLDTAPRSLTGGRRALLAVSVVAVLTGGPNLLESRLNRLNLSLTRPGSFFSRN